MDDPNFVLILSEGQSHRMVGAYGGGDELGTPNLDLLATQGSRFDRAYAASTVSGPSRAAVLTGLYGHSNGVWSNHLPLASNVVHMGRRFQDLGYDTVLTGKWGLEGHDAFGTGTCESGWDPRYWFDGRNHLDELGEDDRSLILREAITLEELEARGVGDAQSWAARATDRAVDFLNYGRSEFPFLLVVSYQQPAAPWVFPPGYAEPFRKFRFDLGSSAIDPLIGKPAHHKEWSQARPNPSHSGRLTQPERFGCNAYVDAQVGRILKMVEEQGIENTWVIYASLNGDMMGGHRMAGQGCAGYEELTHVPLIVRPPQKWRRRRVKAPVNLVDILPTMLELAGAPLPENLHGSSLVSLLSGEGHDDARRSMTEFNRYAAGWDGEGGFFPMRMLVQERYKLVLNLLGSDELYDLEADPVELHNLLLVPDYDDVRDQLHDGLLAQMELQRDPFRGPMWERRSWRKEGRRTWLGPVRIRLGDGYAPPVLDESTGRPVPSPVRDEPEEG